MTTGLREVAHGKIRRGGPLYLKACEVEGKTERTVQSYAETLRHFIRAVDQLQLPNSVRAFGPAHVYLFMGWVRDRGVSAGTQHRRQREVKAFFSWCRRMGYVEENPFMRVPMVRREQKVIQPFSKEDITALLGACNPRTYVGSRMKAMVFFSIGYRGAFERTGLDSPRRRLLDQHRVRVLQGKGRKQRWTAISDVALEALRGYLDGFRGWSDGPLFQTVDGRPLRNHHMNVMFTRHGLKAGVRQVNPHRFRHTFATWAIRASARELDVQYLLGHTSPVMVRRYSATYDSEQAASAHATFSPAMQLVGGS